MALDLVKDGPKARRTRPPEAVLDKAEGQSSNSTKGLRTKPRQRADLERALAATPNILLPLREKVSAKPTDEGSLRTVGLSKESAGQF